MKSDKYIVVNKAKEEMTIIFTSVNTGLLSNIKGISGPDRKVFCENGKWQINNFDSQCVVFQSEIQKSINAALLKWKPNAPSAIDLIMEKMGYQV
jgi:hypothetical protein